MSLIDARVYVRYSGDHPVLSNDLFVPIQVDEAHYERGYEQWGELANLYWMWKNVRHDYVGLMQNRRYLSLSSKWNEDGAVARLEGGLVHRHAWTRRGATTLLQSCDVLIPHRYSLEDISLSEGVYSPYDFFIEEGGSARDIELFLCLIKEKHPEYYINALEFIYGTSMVPWNIFVMKSHIFHGYCSFVFSVICDIEYLSESGSFQRNLWCLLAEFLGNIYLKNLSEKDSRLIIREASIIYTDDDDIGLDFKNVSQEIMLHEKRVHHDKPMDVLYGGHINLVVSFDANYYRPACATISSIIRHTRNTDKITLYVIHDARLSDDVIRKVMARYGRLLEIKFVRIGDTFVKYFPMNRKHINVNAYYRLLISSVLPETVERVIYFDTDVVICDDVTKLWNTDLHGKVLGGARDEDGLIESRRLFGESFNNNYINSGVLLFDVARAKKRYGNLEFLYAEAFYKNTHNITMQDQDILNLAYKEDIFILPLRWNVASSAYLYQRTSHVCGRAEGEEYAYTKKEHDEARRNPAVLHFTGRRKPWRVSCMHPLKSLYWRYYRGAAGYRALLKRYLCLNNYYVTISRGRLSVHLPFVKTSFSVRRYANFLRKKTV
ncbi:MULTISPECIES: glycosyltransferase [unclassified Saccharibacter]|uniref:glycosyltransferase n=1 Tax=unclassified Saccharibacter TaxID=2648722 RepID=UPI0013298699|nr:MULTISPECIES: glycosyltransferase [unclassified Saccharibacter]MXV36467.1 DUF4422 domain-containing protein [Saccharibacter sp. EH611]MXV57629.1 DUF4422 domain-containing protein [Saccharibacter sp. EH70]MXV65064.1 DUF4422 domain-containing protein [Saccharibacter sp. EH60]